MGVIEKSIALTSKDREGNQLLYLPYTKVDNVEGAVDEAQLQNYVTQTDLSDKLAEYVTSADLLAKDYIDITTADEKYLAKTGKAESAKNADIANTITNEYTNISNDGNSSFAKGRLTINGTNGNFTTSGSIDSKFLKVTNTNGEMVFAVDSNGAIRALNGVFAVTVGGNVTANLFNNVSINKDSENIVVGGIVLNDLASKTELNDYVTESELELKNYATKQEIPTQYLKDVTVLNDKITFSTNNLPKTITINNVAFAKQAGNMFWDGILDKPTIPTKTSEIVNDSGFITSIPSEYITETKLNEKGFLTNVDLEPYAKTETVNQQLNQKVSTSEMVNYVTYDSLSKQGFITKDDLPSKFIVSIEVQGNKLICHFNDSTSSQFELYKTGTEAPVWK